MAASEKVDLGVCRIIIRVKDEISHDFLHSVAYTLGLYISDFV